MVHVRPGHERNQRRHGEEQQRAETNRGTSLHQPEQRTEEQNRDGTAHRPHQPRKVQELTDRQHGRSTGRELAIGLRAGIHHMHDTDKFGVGYRGGPEMPRQVHPRLHQLDDFVDQQRPGGKDVPRDRDIECQPTGSDGADRRARWRCRAKAAVEQAVPPECGELARKDGEHHRNPGNNSGAAEPLHRGVVIPVSAAAACQPVDDGRETEQDNDGCGDRAGDASAWPLRALGHSARSTRRGRNTLNRTTWISAATPSRQPIFFPSS